MAICEAILNLIYLGVKVSILYIAYLQAEFIKVPEAKGGGGDWVFSFVIYQFDTESE